MKHRQLLLADPARPLRRVAFGEWCVLTLLLALFCAVLGHARGLGRPDQTLYDAALKLSTRAPSPDIVIIAIDDASLGRIGRWPWPRAVHATLLQKLGAAHARAIGMDLILSEPELASGANPGDAALAAALSQAGNAVLPVMMQARDQDIRGAARATLPVPALAAAATALGHIHLEIDADGIARSVFLREGLGDPSAGAQGWPHFALALLDIGAGKPLTTLPGERNPRPDAARSARWSRDYWMHIPFAGPPGTFTQVSYVDVLTGAVPAATFAGKYVLVGATAAGLGDAYATPLSGQSRAMPGIEISANVLDALLSGRSIERAGAWTGSLLSVLPVLLLMAGLLLLSPRRGLLLAGVLIVATLAAAFAMLRFAGLWCPPTAALAGLILAYPLWSWRRLEATVKYLGAEFMRLDAEPRVLPAPPISGAKAAPGADLLERRMLAVASAAERLRQARRFVSDTLESLPDAALVADSDGQVLLANRAAARVFKTQDPQALRGGNIAALAATLTPKATPAAALTWEQVRALAPTAGQGDAATMEVVTADGAALLARCAATTDADGAVAGWIVSLIDITSLREAEQQRDEVLAFLSHDMRSPQSSILALIELHELDPEDNPKEQVHERIAQYAHRTLELSEQFLQLARAETKEYDLEAVDLGSLAEEAIGEAWAAAQQKRITLKLSFDGEPVPVQADASLLRRAIINLLTNAIKYSPEDTVTTVSVTVEENWHVCRVADRGYGISEKDLAQLFGRFRRFSAPGQPKALGAGLGMAFVKTVIEKHGGQVDVASVLGEGTTFTFRLPPAA